jgi:hypothetical protein
VGRGGQCGGGGAATSPGDGGGAASSPGSGGSGAKLGVGGLSEGGGDHLCGRS